LPPARFCLSFPFCCCFLYYSRPHRHLHTFPTRRSSDLIGLEGAQAFEGSAIQYRVKNASQLHGKRLVVFGGGDSALDWTLELTPDRKSTRLNSSHRTISYAVFCLKKKK